MIGCDLRFTEATRGPGERSALMKSGLLSPRKSKKVEGREEGKVSSR